MIILNPGLIIVINIEEIIISRLLPRASLKNSVILNLSGMAKSLQRFVIFHFLNNSFQIQYNFFCIERSAIHLSSVQAMKKNNLADEFIIKCLFVINEWINGFAGFLYKQTGVFSVEIILSVIWFYRMNIWNALFSTRHFMFQQHCPDFKV